MKIGNFEIGPEHPPFTIAEAGLNHCGDIERALVMVRVAKICGCDAIKFQTFKAVDVCPPDQDYTYQSQGETITEKRINIFRRCELPESAWPVIKAECDKQDIIFMSTPETPADLDILLKAGIPAIKIGSDNLTNLPMLRYCARDDVALPIILSCGMSNTTEITAALYALGQTFDDDKQYYPGMPDESNVILLVCTSEYPCLPDALNLARITSMRKAFPGIHIGFSDHTGVLMSTAMAAALGACVFEAHFTLDRNLPGPDHSWCFDTNGLHDWVECIHLSKIVMGDGIIRPSEFELANKAKYQRVCVSNVPAQGREASPGVDG